MQKENRFTALCSLQVKAAQTKTHSQPRKPDSLSFAPANDAPARNAVLKQIALYRLMKKARTDRQAS